MASNEILCIGCNKNNEGKMKFLGQQFYILTFIIFMLYLYKSLGHSSNDKYEKLLRS